MCEDYDWCVAAKSFYILFEPRKLFLAELPQAARLKIEDVDQANEMNAVLIEAVPTGTFGFDALQVSFAVEFASIVEHIMLAGNMENVFGSAALKYFIKGVELLRLRQLRDISCVDQERRRRRHRVNAIESNLKCFGHIFVRLLVKADMAIADLQET